MYLYSTGWLMFVVGNARAAHYIRGFNGLSQWPEMFSFGFVLGTVIALGSRVILRGVAARHIRQIAWILTGINMMLVVWLAVLTLVRRHGLWLEHLWTYQQSTYRSYGFITPVTWCVLLTIINVWLIHHLTTRARRWWMWLLGQVPLVLLYLLLFTHRWIGKPVFMG